ncbi:hypothetical protein DFR72_117103 [Lentzea flaviverrucosa]|uniref:Uncharacterized protein n=1 Tax=Lentzea flaviverrucosa TaxID=200379 RepID=A0A1H9XU66_9PSEU|nr:hypothetical protein DFR72_117103 [Lentzea flaviverrucosa]SES49223.1 hypothetical protein SAMN05216195_117115 [Lentzea flaviverrucosa]
MAVAQQGEHAPQLGDGVPARLFDVGERLVAFGFLPVAAHPPCGGGSDDDEAEAVGHDVVQLPGDPEPLLVRRVLRGPRGEARLVLEPLPPGADHRPGGRGDDQRDDDRTGPVLTDRQQREGQHRDATRILHTGSGDRFMHNGQSATGSLRPRISDARHLFGVVVPAARHRNPHDDQPTLTDCRIPHRGGVRRLRACRCDDEGHPVYGTDICHGPEVPFARDRRSRAFCCSTPSVMTDDPAPHSAGAKFMLGVHHGHRNRQVVQR